MTSPPLLGISQAACWSWRPHTRGPCPSRASPGRGRLHALPSAALHQPSSVLVVAPTRGAHWLHQEGSSIMPSPLLPGSSRAT